MPVAMMSQIYFAFVRFHLGLLHVVLSLFLPSWGHDKGLLLYSTHTSHIFTFAPIDTTFDLVLGIVLV